MKPMTNFDLTSAALAAFDALGDAFDREPTQANLDALEPARAALGEALSLDTADRDAPSAGALVVADASGMAWIRELVGTHGPTHYGPKATPGPNCPNVSYRRALCGVVYQTGGRNGHAGSSNVAHVTCVKCLEAELAS